MSQALPLPFRTPTERLLRAREDHAICLRLAAFYRACLVRGEDDARERHAWALGHGSVETSASIVRHPVGEGEEDLDDLLPLREHDRSVAPMWVSEKT